MAMHTFLKFLLILFVVNSYVVDNLICQCHSCIYHLSFQGVIQILNCYFNIIYYCPPDVPKEQVGRL